MVKEYFIEAMVLNSMKVNIKMIKRAVMEYTTIIMVKNFIKENKKKKNKNIQNK
jgi:hypothetical protein